MATGLVRQTSYSDVMLCVLCNFNFFAGLLVQPGSLPGARSSNKKKVKHYKQA